MTNKEAKTVFLNRGYVEVEGGTIYDANYIIKYAVQTWDMELHQYDADKYCPNCGAKMVEEQKRSE